MSSQNEAVRAWILASKNGTESHAELAALPIDLLVELHPEYNEYGPQPAKAQSLLKMMESYQTVIDSGDADGSAKEAWLAFVAAVDKGSSKVSYAQKVFSVKEHSGNYWRARWLVNFGLSRKNQDSVLNVFIKTCGVSGAGVASSTTREMATIVYLSLVDRALGVSILPRSTIKSVQSAYHKLHVAQRTW